MSTDFTVGQEAGYTTGTQPVKARHATEYPIWPRTAPQQRITWLKCLQCWDWKNLPQEQSNFKGEGQALAELAAQPAFEPLLDNNQVLCWIQRARIYKDWDVVTVLRSPESNQREQTWKVKQASANKSRQCALDHFKCFQHLCFQQRQLGFLEPHMRWEQSESWTKQHTRSHRHTHTHPLWGHQRNGMIENRGGLRPREASQHLVLLYPMKILFKNKRKQDF